MPQRHVGVKTFRGYEVMSERDYIDRGLQPDTFESRGELEDMRAEIDRLREVILNLIEEQCLPTERLARIVDHWPHSPDLQGLADNPEDKS